MCQLTRFCTLFLSALFMPLAAGAADLPASALLPDSTVLFVRVENVRELREAFRESSLGKVAADPDIRPLVSSLYGGVAELFTNVGERVGANLDELLNLPQGEFAFAIVYRAPEEDVSPGRSRDESPEAIRERMRAREAARERSLQPLIIVDAEAQIPLLMNVLETQAERQLDRGAIRNSVEVDGTEVIVIERGGQPRLVFAERGGKAIIGVSSEAVGDAVRRLGGKNLGPTLSRDTDFTAAIAAGSADPDGVPQIVFFADPVQLLEALSHNRTSVALAYQVLDSFGLDGFGGIGGTMLINGEQFDSVVHLHVLLDSPRDDVLAVIQPKPGKLEAESFVPEDVFNYITAGWDFEQTVDGVGRTVDKFLSRGAFDERVLQKFEERTGVKLIDDLVGHLSGRVSVMQWNEPPARLNSQVTSIVFELENPEAFGKSVAEALEAVAPRLEEDTYSGAKFYKIADPPDLGKRADVLRLGSPHVILFDRYAMYTDSRKFAEKIVQTNQNPDSPRMKNLPEYEVIMAEASARLDGREPFLISFGQPERTYRYVYDLAQAPSSRQALASLAENNPIAAVVYKALEEHKLPPFSSISKYLAPTGGVMYDDATGIHSVGFTLRPLQ